MTDAPCRVCGRTGCRHKHWGKADFFCHPITGQWECLHCGAGLAGNAVDCRCQRKPQATRSSTALKEAGHG